MSKSEKGNKSVKYLQNFAKSYSGHLHLSHNQYAKFHYPSLSGSDLIFVKLTRFSRYYVHKVLYACKRDITLQ